MTERSCYYTQVGKGEQTRQAIVERALSEACRVGLGGLSIGLLAKELGMSKSGLFAHFESKENLQLEVLRTASDRFVQMVVSPALKAPRGEPRIRAVFDRWLEWAQAPFLRGCFFASVSTELGDQPGPLREYLLTAQRAWLSVLAELARVAVREGHFRRGLDTEQFAWHFHALTLAYHYFSRLIRDPDAERRARNAFENLLLVCRS